MDTVCFGKSWDVALALDGDRLLGAMPFLYGRKWGLSYVLQPQLTQFSGPLFCYPDNLSPSHRIDFENRTVALLLDQLERRRLAYVLIHCAPSVSNWLPFYWAGFSQTTRYTYRINDISAAVQDYVESHGFSVVRDFVGHGIGRGMHEAPEVPNYRPERGHPNPRLVKGMTICVEPMVCAGDWHVEILKDGWTVVSADHSLTAHYENTILITDGEPEILTMADDI
jgi:hypothetical protein